ncbi:bacitracin transport system ATP-binding protein [Desulfitispora alkaliphila]|uniref:ABC transporter ATP-binding protein n=1 Tax=Desulfitispora alkaliphila TaxID=622674 RepID=UPI003D1BED14
MNAILKTINLSKHYGSQWAVHQLNMTVEKGEIYGFLGRNGAGKTTTIRMMLGLITPTEGQIEIFESNLKNNKKNILNRIGAIVEFSGFYPNLNAVENMEINARLMGIKKKQAIQEALEIVGLASEQTKLVGKYSLGMKQRLGIARAIVHHPELLILDEPTNGLDPIGIKEMRRLIKSLAEERDITILISSHILSEIEHLANRVGIIHQGVLLEEINMEKLKDANKRYLQVQVSNISKAVRLLETEFSISNYQVLDDEKLRIYDLGQSPAEINRMLVTNSVKVTELAMKQDNLEDYFVQLTGGGQIG